MNLDHLITAKCIFSYCSTTISLTGRVDITGFLEEGRVTWDFEKRCRFMYGICRMNTKCARYSKPISWYEMRLCCKQAHCWKKQPPVLFSLEMRLLLLCFLPFHLSLEAACHQTGPVAFIDKPKEVQTCGLGSSGDVNHSLDVTNRIIH